MTRCLSLRVRIALAAFLLLPLFVHAQETIRRDAPRDVILAQMTVVAPPVIGIDGKEDRLSPGSRIRDTRNMVVLSASLAGQTLPVVYKRDAAGLVHEVWLLTPDEYKALGGIRTSTQQGLQQFIDTLATVFGKRQ